MGFGLTGRSRASPGARHRKEQKKRQQPTKVEGPCGDHAPEVPSFYIMFGHAPSAGRGIPVRVVGKKVKI